MSLGAKLKEERTKNGYTQEDIAKILNIARSTVSSWEVSRTYPDLSSLNSLSKLFGVTLDYLIKDEENINNTQIIQDMDSSNKKIKYFAFGFLLCFTCVLIVGTFLLGIPSIVPKQETLKSEQLEYTIPLTDIMDVSVKEISYGNDQEHVVPEITANVKLREGWQEPGWKFYFDNKDGTAYISLSQNKVHKEEAPKNYFPKLNFVAAQYVRNTNSMDIPNKIVLIDDNTADPPSTAKEQRVIWEKNKT